MFVVVCTACKTNGDANSAEATRGYAKSTASGDGKFCFELTGARDEVLLGEPLTLLATLKNCSNETQSVPDLLAAEFGLLTVRIRRPVSTEGDIYFPAVRRNGRGRPRVNLEPDELMFATVPVYFGRSGWQLQQPGLYEFSASYSVDEIPLDAKPLAIYVEEPSGDKALWAAHTLMSNDAAAFLYLGGGDEKGAAMLRELINELPASRWADYARMGLAIESASNPSGVAQTEACRSLERSISEIDYDWIIALRGVDTLKDCVQYGSMDKDVSQIDEEFVERHPNAAVIIKSIRP